MKKEKLNFLLVLFIFVVSCTNKKVKITVIGENSSNVQAMQTLVEDYQKSNSVELNFKPSSYEESFNKSNQDFANHTGLYDLVLQYNFSLASYVKNNYVFDLAEMKAKSDTKDFSFESDFFPSFWKEAAYYYSDPKNPDDAKIKPIAYPFAGNSMLLVYNKDLFNDPLQKKAYLKKYKEELKVPTDYTSFYKVASFFTQPDKGLYGVALQGAAPDWLYLEWCGFLQGFGGKVLDKDLGWKGNANTKVLLGSQQSIAATNYYKSLKPFNAGNFTTTDGVEQRNILKKGNVAMAIIWSDYIWGLINQGNGKFDPRFGFTPTPGTKSLITGGAFFINRESKNPAAAFKYVQYLLRKDNQIKMVKNGLCSPLRSVYDDPGVQNIPFIPALKTSLERSEYVVESGVDAALISSVIIKYVQKIWNDEISVEKGLKAAKEEIEKERIPLYK